MTDALRVLMLSWRDTRHPEGGGAELFLERIAGGLAQRGHQVTVQCAAYPGGRPEETVGGVRYVRRGGRFSVYPRAALAVLRGRHGRPDVIVDVQNGVPFWTPLVTRTRVVNLTHHVHREQWPVIFGPRAARFGWWLESRVAPRVYRRSRYVTVSHATRHDLAGIGVDVDAVAVVHNGHDGVPDTPAAAKADRPTMVVLGRLVPHKRVELAIEALAALRPELPELALVVVGHGYWEPQLREYAERLGVAGAVRFAGFVDEARKHRLLAEAWVHVMPSVKEGWGLAVVEAAAHGTPSVAFAAAGGTAESVVHGTTGMLVEDPAELVDAVRRILVDADLRRDYAEAAQKHAASFTWGSAVAAFEAELYAAVGRPLLPAPRAPGLPLVVVDERLADRRDVGV